MFDFLIEPIIRIVPKIPEVLFTVLVGYLIITVTIWFLEYMLNLAKLPKLKGIALSVVKTGLWLILIIFIANMLGFTKLAIAISGTALVMAFFLNNAVGPLLMDVVSGVFLCGDTDFKTGSRIKVGKGEDAIVGRLSEVDMRKVRIIDDEGSIHVFPNAVLDRDVWTVIEKPESRAKKAHLAIKNKLKKS